MITAGGTGGHIFPAMALAQKLQLHTEILFVGGGLHKNRYFDRKTFPFQEVSSGLISLKRPISAISGCGSILKGVWQSSKIIDSFNPDIIVGFGSYYTFPTLLAAKCKNVPVVLHEANRIPGRVNKLLSKYAALTGVHFPDTALLLKGNASEIPIPLREGFQLGYTSKNEALDHYGLDKTRTTLLIFGGSQGAQSINKLSSDAIKKLPQKDKESLQILHFTGDSNSALQLKDLYAKAKIKAYVKDFETRMDIAWSAADIMISRSGAGTIAEEFEFEVPGILIPYPEAMDNHQESNADFMVDIVKGAVKCCERDLDSDLLSQEIASFLEDEQEKLLNMKHAIRKYKQMRPRKELWHIILEMIGDA